MSAERVLTVILFVGFVVALAAGLAWMAAPAPAPPSPVVETVFDADGRPVMIVLEDGTVFTK